MTETKTITPELTFELAPSEPTMPELALATNEITRIMEATKPDDSQLTAEEKAMIKEFSQKIDLNNSTQILQYGGAAQQKISRFSETALNNVRTKDMDEVGNMLTGLVVELKGFSADEPEKKGFLGLFKRAGRQLEEMKTRYNTIEKNVNRICDVLEGHKVTLLKDIAVLDKMFEMNLTYFKELTMYIIAGREKLEQVIAADLPALQEKARQSGKMEDAQAANNLAAMCHRFDKKLHDLDLTRTICLQMGPQIRLVQNNDSIMVEKIHSSLVNTIPLWKNQMVIALGLVHSKKAMEAQKRVTDMTNELLRKNADNLKSSTVEMAKEAERGIVDIETLRHTSESLISTLDEVLQIQEEGRTKRQAAAAELAQIEDNLKAKLLEMRDSSKLP